MWRLHQEGIVKVNQPHLKIHTKLCKTNTTPMNSSYKLNEQRHKTPRAETKKCKP